MNKVGLKKSGAGEIKNNFQTFCSHRLIVQKLKIRKELLINFINLMY